MQFRTLAPALLVLATMSGAVQAQATVKPDGQWRAALGLGASLSSGNSKASNLSFNADAVKASAQDKISLFGTAQYAKTNDETTAEQLRLGSRYDRNLSDALFAFGGLDLERNKFSNLKLRSQLSGGLGYHVIKTADTSFDLFGGLSYSADKFDIATDIDGTLRSKYNYTSLFLAEESTHKLSDSTSAKQRLAVYPNLKDRGEFRATFDAGLSVAMSKTYSLNVGLGVTHNSQPGAGRKTTDSLLTTGVSVKFD